MYMYNLLHLCHQVETMLRKDPRLTGDTTPFSDGARCSIDSTFEFRQTDLVDVEAARPVTEIVITPSSLEGDGAERRRRSLPRVIVEENSSSVDRFATTTTASDGDTTTGAEETEPESSSSFDREAFLHFHH